VVSFDISFLLLQFLFDIALAFVKNVMNDFSKLLRRSSVFLIFLYVILDNKLEKLFASYQENKIKDDLKILKAGIF